MIFRNELLWFCMLVINFGLILFAYKKFGRIGLYAWIPISTILANIQVVLLVDLFGFGTTLGNILYAGGFLVTDILAENYGRKEAQRAVSEPVGGGEGDSDRRLQDYGAERRKGSYD